MPIYSYICDCGLNKEQYAPVEKCENPIKCDCGGMMKRCICLPSTDLVDNVRYSSTMGVNPNRIEKAKAMYPGSRYTPDGRLIIRNRKEKLLRMKQRGMTEFE